MKKRYYDVEYWERIFLECQKEGKIELYNMLRYEGFLYRKASENLGWVWMVLLRVILYCRKRKWERVKRKLIGVMGDRMPVKVYRERTRIFSEKPGVIIGMKTFWMHEDKVEFKINRHIERMNNRDSREFLDSNFF